MPRVAVVGGGLSGLTVAFSIIRALPDAKITLYEASPDLGGVIHSERVSTSFGDFVLDHGADMFATDPPAAMELCRELGIESRLLSPREDLAGAMIVRNGKLQRIPEGFVLARATRLRPMLTSSLLSPLGKLRFLLERWRPQSAATQEDDDGVDESVASFIRHRMGKEVLERLAGPLVAGIYTADIERLSARATLGPIVEMVSRYGSLAAAARQRRESASDRSSAGARYQRFRGFPNGTGELIDCLEASLEQNDAITVRRSCPVNSLRLLSPTCWRLTAANSEEDFEEVILAAPARVSAKLLKSISPEHLTEETSAAITTAGEELGAIESSSAAIVVLGVSTEQIRDLPKAFGIVVPPIEGRHIIAISFASHKYEGRCPSGQTIIRVFLGGALRPDLLERDDDALVDLVRGELQELIGLTDAPVTLSRVVRWQDSMPQYHVGHLPRVRRIVDSMDRIPHLSLTSNALHGVGIAPVIAAARRTALSVVDHWNHKKAGDT
ncbi:MAG: protoporphyrinogen oxidase [Planctomycetota bacterium]